MNCAGCGRETSDAKRRRVGTVKDLYVVHLCADCAQIVDNARMTAKRSRRVTQPVRQTTTDTAVLLALRRRR